MQQKCSTSFDKISSDPTLFDQEILCMLPLQALIIADAYNQSSPLSWVDPLFERVILKGEMTYMKQYLSVFHLTSSVLMEIVSRYVKIYFILSAKEIFHFSTPMRVV